MIQEALDNLPDDNSFNSKSCINFVPDKDSNPAKLTEAACCPADVALSQLADDMLASDK